MHDPTESEVTKPIEAPPAPEAPPDLKNFKFKFDTAANLAEGAIVAMLWQKKGDQELTISRQFFKIKRIRANGRVNLKVVKRS